jgi:hypothetical protein
VRLAILLHDIGWYKIDEADIFSKGFGENWKESDVRFLHEREGCRMAKELLGNLGYDRATTPWCWQWSPPPLPTD